MEQADKMPIRVLARRAGVTTATINFYVQQGLLPPPEKLNRTRALYSEEHLEWLEVIRKFQSLGYSLQLLKRALQQWGHSRQTLDRLKSSGAMQAIPESGLNTAEFQDRGAPPMSLEELTTATGLSAEQVRLLEQWGLLRPRQQGRYDPSDQELAAMVKRILEQGVPLEDLALYQDFFPVARRLILANHKIVRRNLKALRRREIGVRELGQPLIRIMDYLLFRTAFEITPNLTEILLGEADFPEDEEGDREQA